MKNYSWTLVLLLLLYMTTTISAFPQRISRPIGEISLDSVQSLASGVAATSIVQPAVEGYAGSLVVRQKKKKNGVQGLGGSVMSAASPEALIPQADQQVWTALANLERDMQLLDNWTGQKAQLSPLELTMLSLSVIAAGSGPLLMGGHITEFLAPSAAAFAASIGIGAEFVGKVAVADGKEVAAASIQCAAEAEGLLANAERSKAVIPLCVGIGASAASISLLVPVLLDNLGILENLQLITEVYLCCPLVAVLAAAVASLALQETRSYVQTAINVGNRRFSKSKLVGRTWLSATEQVQRKSDTSRVKWQTFAFSVLPAPLMGSLVPGALPTKTVVVAALAAAQAAWFLAQAEYSLGRGTDAVALKARSAAVCDTYANQGARSAAILPFTSALASLCAAGTAAIVELPFLESLAAAGGPINTIAEMAIVMVFPTLSALFAAAASVSKARCRVDAEAATQAASTLALEYDGGGDDQPVLRPFRGVVELIRLSITYSFIEPLQRRLSKSRLSIWASPGKLWTWLKNRFPGNNSNNKRDKTVTITKSSSELSASLASAAL